MDPFAKRGTSRTPPPPHSLYCRQSLVLGCCGWSGAIHGAVASGTYYACSPLPSCHGPHVCFGHNISSHATPLGEHFRRPPLCQLYHAPHHGYRLTAMTSCPWDQISKIVSNNPNCPLLHSLCQQARSLRGGQVNVTICGAVHGKFKGERETSSERSGFGTGYVVPG